jgi:aminocarboxymuconate-semialdehyde decarboxylase
MTTQGRKADVAQAIDVHTHFVPRTMPPAAGRNPLWPSIEHGENDTARVMVGGKLFRAIDSRSWDGARRRDDMARDDVTLQVVSPMPELLSHWFPADDADAFATHVNEQIAALCAAHPSSFAGLGTVPLQDVALAARRLADVKAMGLRGVEIGTHINGRALGDATLDEFYAAAEEQGLAVMIHALHPAAMERIGGRPEMAAVAAFPLETAYAATSLLTHGVTERFPNLRIMLSHGGGALPWILPRMTHARGLGGPMATLFARDPAAMARGLFYDTVVYDAEALRFLAGRVGTAQLMIGSDYPFTIMQPRPVAFATEALGVDAEVLARNTERLLGWEA